MKSKHYENIINIIDETIMVLVEKNKKGILTKDEMEKLISLIDQRDKLQDSEAKRDGVKLNANTVLQAGVSLASILVILNYEKLDVISSKAFSLGTRLIGR